MLDDMVQKIKTLPPLPKSFHEINALCASEDANVASLAKVIEKDPMLVANLLKIANSPLYGFSKEIKTLLQAVSLFGMSTTKTFCTQISAKKLLKIDIEPYGVTPEEFAKISNLQGLLASFWYEKENPEKKQMLFLTALMQEVGKIFIADEIVKNNEITQFKSEISTAFSIEQVEKSFTGTITSEVTTAIFEHWEFDEQMVEALRQSYSPLQQNIQNKEAIALFIIRKAIPLNSPLSQRSINTAISVLQRTSFNEENFTQAIEKVLNKEDVS